MTHELYLEDSYLREFDAEVQASTDGWCLFSRTAFHPGGGGQHPDRGRLEVDGDVLPVTAVREDDDHRVWHQVGRELPAGQPAHGVIDWPFRLAMMRHHALMHV